MRKFTICLDANVCMASRLQHLLSLQLFVYSGELTPTPSYNKKVQQQAGCKDSSWDSPTSRKGTSCEVPKWQQVGQIRELFHIHKKACCFDNQACAMQPGFAAVLHRITLCTSGHLARIGASALSCLLHAQWSILLLHLH